VLEVIKSLKGDTNPETTPMLVTSEVACWRYGDARGLNSRASLLRRNQSVSGIMLTVLTDCSSLTRTTALLLHEPLSPQHPSDYQHTMYRKEWWGNHQWELPCNRGASSSFPPQRSCPVQCGGVLDGALVFCVLEPSGRDDDADIQRFEARKYFIAREQLIHPSPKPSGLL